MDSHGNPDGINAVGMLEASILQIKPVATCDLGEAATDYLTHILGPPPAPQPPPFHSQSGTGHSLWEFLRRARNFMSFPRELEETLRTSVKSADVLGVFSRGLKTMI